MVNVSITRKISIFLQYRKTLRSLRNELLGRFNIRVDSADRMYTVINIPEEIIGEPYNIRKSDIDKISEKYIKEYTAELAAYLNANGMGELFSFYELKKVDKYSYLIVIGYSMFRSNEFYNRIYYAYLPILVGLCAGIAIYFGLR